MFTNYILIWLFTKLLNTDRFLKVNFLKYLLTKYPSNLSNFKYFKFILDRYWYYFYKPLIAALIGLENGIKKYLENSKNFYNSAKTFFRLCLQKRKRTNFFSKISTNPCIQAIKIKLIFHCPLLNVLMFYIKLP